MTARITTQIQEVAGGRLATSAQPPRVPSFSPLWFPSSPTPQPISAAAILDTPDALLEGLRYFTASRPLPAIHLFHATTLSRHLLT